VLHPLGWTRRAVLGTAGAVAAGGVLAGTAGPASASDEYDTLRWRWCNLVNGTGYDPNAEPFRSRLTQAGAHARQLWDAANHPFWLLTVRAQPRLTPRILGTRPLPRHERVLIQMSHGCGPSARQVGWIDPAEHEKVRRSRAARRDLGRGRLARGYRISPGGVAVPRGGRCR
jgi:hypothetical protein